MNKVFLLTVFNESAVVYYAQFAPVFPHTKNLYEAFQNSHNPLIHDLIGKLNQSAWSEHSPNEWRQSLVHNKKKLLLIICESKCEFYATVPMCTLAYDKKQKDKQ